MRLVKEHLPRSESAHVLGDLPGLDIHLAGVGFFEPHVLHDPQHPASDGAIRSAMTAVLQRQTHPRNFRPDGWLEIGFNGAQPVLAESYIGYGSVYLCTAFFLPLTLPPDAPFWTAPAEPWTCKAGWDGASVPIDHRFVK